MIDTKDWHYEWVGEPHDYGITSLAAIGEELLSGGWDNIVKRTDVQQSPIRVVWQSEQLKGLIQSLAVMDQEPFLWFAGTVKKDRI